MAAGHERIQIPAIKGPPHQLHLVNDIVNGTMLRYLSSLTGKEEEEEDTIPAKGRCCLGPAVQKYIDGHG
jgi:hypothetical protein